MIVLDFGRLGTFFLGVLASSESATEVVECWFTGVVVAVVDKLELLALDDVKLELLALDDVPFLAWDTAATPPRIAWVPINCGVLQVLIDLLTQRLPLLTRGQTEIISSVTGTLSLTREESVNFTTDILQSNFQSKW